MPYPTEHGRVDRRDKESFTLSQPVSSKESSVLLQQEDLLLQEQQERRNGNTRRRRPRARDPQTRRWWQGQ